MTRTGKRVLLLSATFAVIALGCLFEGFGDTAAGAYCFGLVVGVSIGCYLLPNLR